MKFTVLLCTLNRKELALLAVNSIIRQTYADFEVIVVDQSNEDSKADFEKLDKRVIYYHSDKKGLSYNRNIGIAIASGDYICLMDDDAIYESNNLENIQKIISEKNSDIICGMMLDPKTKKISLNGMKRRKIKITTHNIMEYCSSPSLVIKASYAKKLRFDDDFGVGRRWGCGEEIDIVLRAMYEGAEAYFSPSIVVYHPSVNKRKLNIDKAAAYSLGYGACCAKHYKFYGNKDMLRYYRIALIKHYIAFILSYLTNDQKMKILYRTNINNKKLGYKEYTEYLQKIV